LIPNLSWMRHQVIRCAYGQSLLFPGLDEEMERLKPKAVTMAGMSLGGSLSQIMAMYVARKYGHTLDRKVSAHPQRSLERDLLLGEQSEGVESSLLLEASLREVGSAGTIVRRCSPSRVSE
jgi:hypothetical protein